MSQGFANSGVDLDETISGAATVVRGVAFDLDLAMGRINGLSEGGRFGYNPDIDTTTDPEHIWTYGGLRTSPTSSFTLYAASDSASDTDVDITAVYLDASGNLQTVTFNLNGQTPIDTGVTATECTRAYVDPGSNNALVGNVSLTRANSFSSGVPSNQNEVLAHILAADGESHVLADRVPTGYSYRIKRLSFLADGAAVAKLQARESGAPQWLTKVVIPVSTYDRAVAGLVFAAGTDIRMVVESVSADDTMVSGAWLYDLVAV